jgi:hypothetical protein
MADWLILFETAMRIIDRAEATMGSRIGWSIGGGTMLHEMFGHRFSRDLDIFVSDPQVLLFLTPRTNDAAEQICDNRGSYVEASNFIKFVTPDGEIDFNVAPHLTKSFAVAREIETSLGGNAGRDPGQQTIISSGRIYRA